MPAERTSMNGLPDTKPPAAKKAFGIDEAKQIGEILNIYWEKFDIHQFVAGLNVELEHGLRSPETDITHDDAIATGKIALAHLNKTPDYYRRLAEMKKEKVQRTTVRSKTENGSRPKHNGSTGVYQSNEVITWKKKK
ncbi:MAG: DUF5661 family protein [Bacteroidota bacterium]